jgi:hypothetical protein
LALCNIGDVVAPFSTTQLSKGAVVSMVDMDTLEVEADVVAEARHEYETGVGWFSRGGHEAPAPAEEKPQA